MCINSFVKFAINNSACNALHFLCIILFSAAIKIKCDQVKSADSDKIINDAGNPGHVSENLCYQIKTEKSDQSPVDGAYDNDCQYKTIQKFIIHVFSSFSVFIISKTGEIIDVKKWVEDKFMLIFFQNMICYKKRKVL